MPKRTNRVAWGLAAVLAVVVLGGAGVLGVRLKPYWVAKYRGEGANLQGAILIFAPVPGSALNGADLRSANLRGANLAQTSFGVGVRIAPASDALQSFLIERDPVGADLTGADLTGVRLEGASFEFALLLGSHLRGADLRHVEMIECDLRDADLTDTDLTGANLLGSSYNCHTRWPEGFDPIKHGAVLVK